MSSFNISYWDIIKFELCVVAKNSGEDEETWTSWLIDRWMDGWMDRWMDGWMNECKNECKNGW
jgi:hypothetical protein